jgi:hypothetical protein
MGFWLLLAAGTGMILSDLIERKNNRFVTLALLAMLIPMGSLVTYRFSYAYFYATIIPAASLVPGLVAARLESRINLRASHLRDRTILALVVPLVASGWWFYSRIAGDTISPQRRLLQDIREIFPRPVPYIDRCHMLATYPKTGLFMTLDVLQAYREQGEPIMRSLVEREQPLFLLANVSGLTLDRTWEELSQLPHHMLREDFDYLRASYLHHWGPVWVAGARVPVEAGNTVAFEIPVTGTYTVESIDSVQLDDEMVGPGPVRWLKRGTHRVRSQMAAQSVVLRIGDHLHRPRGPPPPEPVFSEMGFKDLPLRNARRQVDRTLRQDGQ